MFPNPIIRICLLAIAISTLFSGCVFNNEDDFINELAIPDPAAVKGSIKTIDLENYNPGDTIDIFGTTFFQFSLDGQHGKLESAQAYLNSTGDNWNVVSSNETDKSITISLDKLTNGFSVLKLDLVTRTGSGSLAEAVGAEKFNITLKWVLRIDVTPPQRPLPTLTIVDGFLTMEWDAYTKPNFQSYVVRRTVGGISSTFEITDREVTRWKDEAYVGGSNDPTEYTLAFKAETGTATSLPIRRKDPLVFTFSFNPSDSMYTLKWKPTKFYGAFKEYRFSDGSVKSLTNVGDSTITQKSSAVRFGGDSKVGISVQSTSESMSFTWNWSSCTAGMPLPVAPVGKVMFNTYLNSMVAVDANKKLLALNEQLEPVGEIATLKGTVVRMPYPGNYVYTNANLHNDDDLYRLKLEDQSEVLFDNSIYRSNTVASNGLVCTEYFRPPIQVRPGEYTLPIWRTRVIDAAGGSAIYNEDSNTTKLTAAMSEDGKFIWANDNRVFRISGGSSELIGVFTGTGSFSGFRPDKGNEMMFRDGRKILIYDANTLSLIRTINPPTSRDSWSGVYDVQTKSMLWMGWDDTYGRIYLVHIESGASKSVPVSEWAIPQDLYLVNGILIYNGRYIKVM